MGFSCANCRNEDFKQASSALSRHVAGREFKKVVSFRQCTSCKAKYYTGEDLARFDLAVAINLANGAVIDAEALRFMRKATGLQAKEFADLLGVRPETVSRWESGKAGIDRATYAVLQQFLLDRLAGSAQTAKRLRVLMHPKRLKKETFVDDVMLATMIDMFSNPNGVSWMKGVDAHWIDPLIKRRFLLPPDPARGRPFHVITDTGREFADRVLNRRAA